MLKKSKLNETNQVAHGASLREQTRKCVRHSVSSLGTPLSQHDTHHNITSHTNLFLQIQQKDIRRMFINEVVFGFFANN